MAQACLGHPVFTNKEGRELTVCQIPKFFEIFPIILSRTEGIVSPDNSFRCAESKLSI